MEYWGMLVDSEETDSPVSRLSLHFPCDTYTQYPAACYRYILRKIANELDADTARLTKECLGLSGHSEWGCFHGLGAMNSRSVAAHPKQVMDLCQSGTFKDQVLCIEGVVEKMADFNEKQALAVCAVLNGDHSKICRAAAKEKMYRLNKPTMPLYRGQESGGFD